MAFENEKIISCRVDGETATKVKELAKRLNITNSECMLHILKKFIKDNNL